MTFLPEPALPAPVTPRLRAVPDHNLDTGPPAASRPPAHRRSGPAVVLVTEGTYPHAHGGVSVWCDQLVQGLPEVPMEIVALTAFSHQRPVWDVPDSVGRVTSLGLWDVRRPRPLEGDGALSPAAVNLAQLLTAQRDDVAGFRRFLDRAARPQPEELVAHLDVTQVLHALDREVRHSTWPPLAGLRAADLVQVAEMLDHSLRPLAIDAGPAAIYHASSNGLAALVGMMARRRHGARFLLTEHGIYLRERYLELRRTSMSRAAKALLVRFHRLVNAAAYAEAAVIAPGSQWNQRWEARYGAPAARMQTIYNGIDPDEFPVRMAEPSEPVVSWLGRIDPIKDLETLIRSFAVVNAARPDARLRLYGRTPAGNEGYRAAMDTLITKLGLDGVVTFEGGVAASADAYQAAQVGVLSSISEGFPYSLIEAMACGLPTVATGVGGVPEAVSDAGLVVPPRAPEAMGEAILELLADAARRRDMGFRARRRVVGLFTLEHCLEGYRQLYDELARGPGVALYLARRPGSGAEDGADDVEPLDTGEHRAVVEAVGGPEAMARAVDAEELAATLESVGVTDAVATDTFAAPDVFALAERAWDGERHRRGAGASPVPSPPPPPALPVTVRGTLGRGIAYVLPALVVAAAAMGGAPQTMLVAASAVGWGLAQGGGVLAYTVLHRTSDPTDLAPLRRGLFTAALAIVAAGLVAGVLVSPADGLGVALPLLHLLGSTALVMARKTRHLLAALVPVTAVSAGALAWPTSELADWVAPFGAATVVVTLALVAILARRRPPPSARHLLRPVDWLRSVPLVVCGWATAVFALLAVTGVSHLPAFVGASGRVWLLVGLPLWVMVAGCEWLLLRIKTSLKRLLGVTGSLTAFRNAARWTVALWLALAAAALEGATVVAAVVAGRADVPSSAALAAASLFCFVALALVGITILTAAGRVGVAAAVAGFAALLLAGTASTPYDVAGVADDTAALAVAAGAALALCLAGARTLVDPTTHR